MTLHRPGRWQPRLEPQPFTPESLRRIRFDLHPRLNAEEAIEILETRPDGSFWIPDSEEFILVDAWRRRAEMSSIHTFGAFANEDALMEAVMDAARNAGQAAMVVVDINEIRSPAFFRRQGFNIVEEIVTYSHNDLRSAAEVMPPPRMAFQRLFWRDRSLLDKVLAVDHASFPWFWWNSREEFGEYLDYPGVEAWVGTLDGEVVAYAGMTRYHGWAHLDRIATAPSVQGQGLGRETLQHMMREGVRHGARSLALSTQQNNQQSRHLYERSGFEATPRDDYSIHIASFDDARVLEGIRSR